MGVLPDAKEWSALFSLHLLRASPCPVMPAYSARHRPVLPGMLATSENLKEGPAASLVAQPDEMSGGPCGTPTR